MLGALPVIHDLQLAGARCRSRLAQFAYIMTPDGNGGVMTTGTDMAGGQTIRL